LTDRLVLSQACQFNRTLGSVYAYSCITRGREGEARGRLGWWRRKKMLS